MENEIIEAVETVQIRVENDVIAAFAEVGGYTDGITIERDILPIGFEFKAGKYLYADGAVSVRADYVEPTDEPTEEPTLSVEEKIIEIQSKIDLLNQSVDLIVLDTL